MDDNNWLEDQMMTIPVEEFIKMRINLAEYEKDLARERLKNYDLGNELKEAHKTVADYKAQMMEVLGVEDNPC